jgi:hypothetical protein
MGAVPQPATVSSPWSPARLFLLIATLFHIPLGVIGLLIDPTFPIGPAAAARAGSEHVFGILETNGWHSLAALGVGLFTAYFVARPQRAREAAMALGVFHVGLVVALILWDPSTFWLASNAADQVVHTATALGGIGAALLTTRKRPAAPTAA